MSENSKPNEACLYICRHNLKLCGFHVYLFCFIKKFKLHHLLVPLQRKISVNMKIVTTLLKVWQSTGNWMGCLNMIQSWLKKSKPKFFGNHPPIVDCPLFRHCHNIVVTTIVTILSWQYCDNIMTIRQCKKIFFWKYNHFFFNFLKKWCIFMGKQSKI